MKKMKKSNIPLSLWLHLPHPVSHLGVKRKFRLYHSTSIKSIDINFLEVDKLLLQWKMKWKGNTMNVMVWNYETEVRTILHNYNIIIVSNSSIINHYNEALSLLIWVKNKSANVLLARMLYEIFSPLHFNINNEK